MVVVGIKSKIDGLPIVFVIGDVGPGVAWSEFVGTCSEIIGIGYGSFVFLEGPKGLLMALCKTWAHLEPRRLSNLRSFDWHFDTLAFHLIGGISMFVLTYKLKGHKHEPLVGWPLHGLYL